MTLLDDFYATASEAGIAILSKDKCARILAWVYVFGADTADVTYNQTFNRNIRLAQKEMNAYGGEKPNAAVANLFRYYCKTIEDYNNPPPWVAELEAEYSIKMPRLSDKPSKVML